MKRRFCLACKLTFEDHNAHADHFLTRHGLIVVEIVNVNLGRATRFVLCTNDIDVIEHTIRGEYCKVNRDKYLVRPFNNEAPF